MFTLTLHLHTDGKYTKNILQNHQAQSENQTHSVIEPDTDRCDWFK